MRRTLTVAAGALFIALLALATISHVPTRVEPEDARVFKQEFGLEQPTRALSAAEELNLIRHAQQAVFARVPSGEAIPERASREPADLVRHGSGVCYDHARTFDKLYRWLGFKTRHVYVMYPVSRRSGRSMPAPLALFHRWTTSHAATEVKTQRGWVLVDSVTPWLSITVHGAVIAVDQLREHVGEFAEPLPESYTRPYTVIRGLYSRQGQLYPPRWPFPDFNAFEMLDGWWD